MSKNWKFGWIISLAIWCGGSWAVAHPGHQHHDHRALRTWTEKSGVFQVYGAFVAACDGRVQIRKEDDALVSFGLERLSLADQEWVQQKLEEIRRMSTEQLAVLPAQVEPSANLDEEPLLLAQRSPQERSRAAAGQSATNAPAIANAFQPFARLKAISYRWDDKYFYVESNGIPNHPLMVGITAWQQQVPLPQKYFGANAWQIPLHPAPAKEPASAKGRFLRGAIAVAVNGIPIFNPLNNRGDDAYLFGELDEYGGHCGRADDYHYHLAPVHLEKQVGQGSILAYALDGYPIYGYDEPDGTKVVGLDWLNGHKNEDGHYHYHATKTYPYLNGGFYGEVTEVEGQVDPQPRAEGVRAALPPMKGAKIVGFKETRPNSYLLTYDIRGGKGTVEYSMNTDGTVSFEFIDVNGTTTNETYQQRRRPGGGGDGGNRPPRPGENRPRRPSDDLPPRPGENPPPRENDRPPLRDNGKSNTAQSRSQTDLPKLVVTSPAFGPGEKLPAEFTCDGAGSSPPVNWSGAPQETKCFAVSLWHIAPDREKSYWVVYNIPAKSTGLEKNSKSVGTLGFNDKRRAAYDPMCSKGPGAKEYHITVFALSSELKLSPDQANRANLLAAIKNITLAEGTLTYQYERERKD